MNASALLQSQGWLGKGHSLDSHRFSSASSSNKNHAPDSNNPSGRNARGLVNPLLISRNTDGRGIGNKTHYTSDQWWLSAFDQKLKGLDTTNSKQGITQTVTEGKLDSVGGRAQEGKYTGTKGLYAFFVKGGLLEGTVEVGLLHKEGTATPEGSDNGGGFSLRAKLAAKRARKEAKRAKELSKRERRERKEVKRFKRERKEERKKRGEKGGVGESKEERKQRREERKKKKEVKRRKRAEKEKGE